MKAAIQAGRALVEIAKIEAGGVIRSRGAELILMAAMAGFLSWGAAQIEPMSKLIEEKMQGKSLSWPGSTTRVEVEAWNVGENQPDEPVEGAEKKLPQKSPLKWVAIARGGDIAVGSRDLASFKQRGGNVEALGTRSAESYFNEASRLGKLPAAIVYPEAEDGKGARGEIRMAEESGDEDQERVKEELSALMGAGSFEQAWADAPEKGSLGLAEIEGLPTKAKAAAPRAEDPAAAAGQAHRAALGAAATLMACMSAGWMMAAARRRGRLGEFEVHASSQAKTWALALSLPVGSAMAYSTACAVGFGVSTIVFFGQIDPLVAAQACVAMLIQSMAFACWGALTLSFALRKTIGKFLMLLPLLLIMHAMREAIVNAAGGPSGVVSALMSDDLRTWAIAAASYASTALLAAALAHFKIGSGQRRIWQAKPLQ